jgi:hypothetical protein
MPAHDDEEIVKYLNIFEDHLASLHTPEERNLDSSLIPPTGCHWSPEEKNVFFHALSIHSRLRPDLIAEMLPTKTVVDVCMYIDLLEESLGSQLPFSIRHELPIAYDASEEWIEKENELAEELVEAEARWEEERLRKLRKSRADAAMRIVKVNAGGKDAGKETTMKAQKQARVGIKQSYAVEDAMRSLDESHLKVLDMILGEGEIESTLASTAGEVSGNRAMHEQRSVVSSQAGSEVDIPFVDQPMNMDGIVNEPMIDPILLAMSAQGQETSIGSSAPHSPSSTQLHSSVPLHASFDPPSAPTYDPYAEHETPQPPIASTSATVPDQSRNEGALQTALKEQLKFAEMLSPKSKRLYEKRIRMRFKRAELSGVAISFDMHMKRGRKPKEKMPRIGVKRKRSSGSDKGEEDHEEGHDTHHDKDDEPEKQPNPNRTPSSKRGLAKIQKMFQDGHVDRVMLQRETLDLFHLKNLGRLMKYVLDSKICNIFRSDHNSRLNGARHDAPADVNTSISGETLKFLHALVSIFVTDLVRQAIICRELEGKIKRHTKVWRFKEGEVRDLLPSSLLKVGP